MTPDEALAFWYGRVDFERRQPKPTDLKLDRMRALLRLLGDPHDRLRVAHVAGSKGKGSVSAMLAAALPRAGYRTGLFTSPHLSAVEERIQIDGTPVSRAEMAAGLTDIRPAVEALDRRGTPPTFFEVGTALGFLHFLRRRCDVAVVEVGLGGRFDSTNVVRPAVSVITSISLDHMHILGNTVALIAREKAGIIKPGVPCVSGATAPDAEAVIAEVCRQRRAPLRRLGHDFDYSYQPGRLGPAGVERPSVVTLRGAGHDAPAELALLGEHQAANAAAAVAALDELRRAGLTIPPEAVAGGLAGVVWPARLEVVGTRPLVLLDCAHSPASTEVLAEALRASVAVPGRRRLVFAASADKDWAGMLAVLGPAFDAVTLTRYTNNPRAVPPADLAATLARVAPGVPAEAHEDPRKALAAARASAGPDDLVCVTGSVFLAGELRPVMLAGRDRAGGASGDRAR